MAAKKKSNLGPKVGKLLEQALLEALKRHYGKSGASRKKKAPVRKKKAATRKKKAGKKKPVRRRARRA